MSTLSFLWLLSLSFMKDLKRGYGLESWSEEGLEANNATLIVIREMLCRKFNELVNLEDCFKRLWVGSDPQVLVERSKGRGVFLLCLMRA